MNKTTYPPKNQINGGLKTARQKRAGAPALTRLLLLAALLLSVSLGTRAANILYNGNFNLPASGAVPTGWTNWSWGSGWANHENNSGVSYDGSYYVVAGAQNYNSGGGGFYQTVSGAAGVTYTLSVVSGADAWWLPYGEMRLFFLDAAGTQIGLVARCRVLPGSGLV